MYQYQELTPFPKCSIATNRSNSGSAGSQVSAQFSTTSPKHTRFQPVRSKGGSEAQAGLGWRLVGNGSVAVILWRL